MDKTERDLRLLDCDIEIQKYHQSTSFSILLPFILTFASAGIATQNVQFQRFFIALSMILMFLLASLIFMDAQHLKKKYQHRKKLLSKL